MTANEFIKLQAFDRAKAAAQLKEPLEINGIDISAGCTQNGIEVRSGIAKLAEILEAELAVHDEELTYDTDRIKRTKSFEYSGVTFFEYNYIEKQVI